MLKLNSKEVISKLKSGQIGIIPTDTLYGLVGLALDKKVIKRIYRVKKRNPQKPFIILISSISDLEKFKINIEPKVEKILERSWPGKISIILPCEDKSFLYLHRETNSLAFRLPDKPNLLALLKSTGPLVAPTANPEDQFPAQTIGEAKEYFNDKVDFYVDEGKIAGRASKIISVGQNGQIEIIRQ